MAKLNRSILGPGDCQIVLLWNEAKSRYDVYMINAAGTILYRETIHGSKIDNGTSARMILPQLAQWLESWLPF